MISGHARERTYDPMNVLVWCFVIPTYCLSFWVGVILLVRYIAASW